MEQLARLAAADAAAAGENEKLEEFLPPMDGTRRLAMLDRYELNEEWRRVWIEAECDEDGWTRKWHLRSIGSGELLDEADTPKGQVCTRPHPSARTVVWYIVYA